MPLKETQSGFKALMLRPAHELRDSLPEFSEQFYSDEASAIDRLGVYHNNVVGSLTEALRRTFPVVEDLVGVDFFKSMARGFIFSNPPQSACLHDYGAGFDLFIQNYEHAKSVPYLADMAKLEIAMNDAYYALDDAPLAPDALSKIAPEELADARLGLRCSAHLVCSDHPLAEIRAYCLNKGEPEPDLRIDKRVFYLIHRPQFDVVLTPINEDAYAFLSFVQEGLALGESLEKTAEQFPDFDFTAFLQKHIMLETFCALDANTESNA